MKTLIHLLFLIIFSGSVSGQRSNTIDCKITYLPSIKNDDKLIKISKQQAKKTDSLIALKSFKIKLSQDDINKFNELYNRKAFDGERIYKISDSTYSKILKNKEVELDLNLINTIGAKSILDLISGVIDGAPFTLTAKTSNNTFIFNDNFRGMPKLIELREYLIFYFIYQETKFCKPSNKLVEEYFSREKLLKNIMYSLTRIESEY
ncbi:hypothetical protein ACKW6Q_07350 [Chryseobacterium kwangjuense]|uniref:Uncharacterized protein n=1 Tax=Chryseobacterium kwangjuense TaxID=267125 RepID=A0ABW9K2U5_9FLAO